MQEVTKANDELDDATSRNDAAALSRIYADDYVFVAYNGTVHTKEDQVRAVRSGVLRFTSYTVIERTTRIYGAIAVTVLRRKQAATVRGEPRPDDVRATRVWVKRNGTWQLVSAQVTPVSAGVPVAKPSATAFTQPSIPLP